MKPSAAYLQGVLAILGLTASYLTWQRAPTPSPGEIKLVEFKPGQLKSLDYSNPPHLKSLDYSNPPHHVTIKTEWLAKGTIEIDGKNFLANESLKTLIDRLSSLSATRDLGVLEARKLKEFGLADDAKKLKWATANQTIELMIGVVSAGFAGNYVLDGRNHHVYLSNNPALSELDNAQMRLVDRRLHTFNSAEIDLLKVTVAAHEYELIPSVTSPKVKLWHESIWRLLPLQVLGKDEIPIQGRPVTSFRVEYLGKKKPLGWVEMASVGSESFARSEHTVGWMKVQPGKSAPSKELAELISSLPPAVPLH